MAWVIEYDERPTRALDPHDVKIVRPIRKPVPAADAPDGDDDLEDGDVLEDLDAPKTKTIAQACSKSLAHVWARSYSAAMPGVQTPRNDAAALARHPLGRMNR